MKLKITIASLLTFLFVQINAQEIGIEWGKGTTAKDETNPTKFVCNTKDCIYTLRNKMSGFGDSYFIEKYNKKDLKFVSSKKLDNGIGVYTSGIYLIDDKLIGIVREKKELYAYYFNPATLAVSDKKLVMNIDKWATFEAKLSEDKKQILVYSNEKTEKFQYKIIDGALNVKDYQLDYTFKKNETQLKYILNNNNLYILTAQSRPKEDWTHKEGLGKSETCTLSLISHNYKNNTIEQLALKSKNLHFINFSSSVHHGSTQIDLKMDDASNLLVSAIYTTEQHIWEEYDGFLIYKVNAEKLQIITTAEMDLDKNTLLKFLTEKEIKNGKEIMGLQINNIITKEDGKILIIAEPNYYAVHAGHSNSWNNISKSIIVASINTTGQIEWTTVIPKLQVKGDMWEAGKYFSYLPIYKNQTLYLLYNDDPQNLIIQNFEDLNEYSDRSMEGSVLVQATVKADGTFSRKTLLKYEKNAVYLNPSYFLPVSDNEMIMQGSNGKNEALGRLKY